MSESEIETQDETPSETSDETPALAEPTPEADEEQEAAEAEDAEPDQDEIEQPEQPQGMSEKDMEKAFERLNREGVRHASRVQEIMGDGFADLVPCELCWPGAAGFHFAQVPEDQRVHVLMSLGLAPPRQLKPDTQARVCDGCDGWGVVATGSHVQGMDEAICVECEGRGWVGQRAQQRPAQPVITGPTAVGNGEQAGTIAQPDTPEVAALKAQGFIVIPPTPPSLVG